MEIDPQGGFQVKEKFPEAHLIFIKPPSMEVLRERLVGRSTDAPNVIELRLKNALGELELSDKYDECIVNDDLETAVSDLSALIDFYQRNEVNDVCN